MKQFFFIALLLSTLQPAGLSAGSRQIKTTNPARRRLAVRKARPVADPAAGDNIYGDDLAVRRAAVAALGGYAGSVVVADPSTGRILSIVNQKLALTTGL